MRSSEDASPLSEEAATQRSASSAPITRLVAAVDGDRSVIQRIMRCVLLAAILQLLLTSYASAVPVAGDKFRNSVAVREVAPLFQVRRAAADLTFVGRHIAGDVTVEIETQRGVDLQVQWATHVMTSSASGPYNFQPQQQLGNSESTNSSNHGLPAPSRQTSRSYAVPIVGDSWCSIQETSWLSTDNDRKHLISTLNCRHLPSTGTDSGDRPSVILTVKALDGAVHYQRHLANDDRDDRASPTCFDWHLPDVIDVASRTMLVQSEAKVALNFSTAIRCNATLPPAALKLVWVSDSSPMSLEWIAGTTLPDSIGNGNATTGCSMQQRAQIGNWTSSHVVNVECRVTSLSPEVGYLYTVYVDIQSADRRRHSGTFTAMFARDEMFRETVSLSIDLIVSAGADDTAIDQNRKSPTASTDAAAAAAASVESYADDSGFLRMRSCSDGLSGPWRFGDNNSNNKNNNQTLDFVLRSSVPDCIVCAAEMPGFLAAAADRRSPPPPEVRIMRSDGLILGSEESHSVYWYREPGGRASVAVLLLRAPSDEYTGDYVCSVPTLAAMATSDGGPKRWNRRKGNVAVDGANRKSVGKDRFKQIKFRLNVLQ